jgi:hypothetical protein
VAVALIESSIFSASEKLLGVVVDRAFLFAGAKIGKAKWIANPGRGAC